MIITDFSRVTSNSSEVKITPSGSAPTVQLVYKRVIDVLRRSKAADASM